MKTIQVSLILCAIIMLILTFQTNEIIKTNNIADENLDSLQLAFALLNKEMKNTNKIVESIQDENIKSSKSRELYLYKTVMVRYEDNQFGSIKWNVQNGQSYRLEKGKWILMIETDTEPIKEGVYGKCMIGQQSG